MRFNILIVSIISVIFAACSSPINDRPTNEAGISLGSSETQCLSNVSVDIKDYFEGKSNEQKISKVWDCTSRALELFANYTKGKNQNVFEAVELRNFLQKYFLGNQKITDEFLNAGMKLKSSILGGSETNLSKDDIARTRRLIDVLKKASIELLPFQPLRPSSINLRNDDEVDNVVLALKRVTKMIANELLESTKDYSFADLYILLIELNSFFKQSNIEVTEFQSLLEAFPVFSEVKNLAISRPKEIISKTDWVKIVEIGTNWYGLILKISQLHYKYIQTQARNISIPMIFWGSGLVRMFHIASEVKDEIINSIKSWPAEIIPMSEFNTLIDKIGNEHLSQWFIQGLTIEGVKKTLDPLIKRLMNGLNQVQFSTRIVEVSKPNGVIKKVEVPVREMPDGLTVGAMENVFYEFSRFVDGQNYIEALFDKTAGKNNWTLSRSYDQGELIANSFFISPDLQSAEISYDIKNILKNTRPLFRGEEPKIYFTSLKNADSNHSFYNLFQSNWMNMVARIFIRGYAEEKSRAEGVSGLTLREVTRIYDDFWYFGRDIKFLDKRENTHEERHKTAMKRFMEANLFSFESDGGDTLKLGELTQLLSFLVSGKTLSQKIHDQLASICKTGEDDVYGKPMIDANCYQASLFDDKEKLYEQYWSTMPGLKSYYNSLSVKDKKYFTLLLIKAAMGDHVDHVMYESDDTDALATILHYVEAVFSRFDENNKSGLNKQEALKAFPVFEYELSKLGCMTNDKMLKDVFTYLLKHGHQPDTKFPKVMSFLWWLGKGKVGLQFLNADRIQILEILATISEASSSIDNTSGKECPGEDEAVIYEEETD